VPNTGTKGFSLLSGLETSRFQNVLVFVSQPEIFNF
jgi:hypothetical protein